MRKIMACLDVGTDKVKLVVGEMVRNKLNVLAVADAHSKGVSNGLLLEPNALLDALREVIQRCEDTLGLKIKQMIVKVPSNNAAYMVVNGSVNIENEDHIIEGRDIVRVINSSLRKYEDNNYEIITMLPTGFVLDNEKLVKNPKGLVSTTLGVRGVLVYAPKKNFYPILACLDTLGIEVLDINLSVIGNYYEFKNKELDSSVVAVVDLGADSTSIGIFNKGILTNSSVLNIGGDNIDSDISFVYKLSENVSRDVKEKLVILDDSLVSSSDTLVVNDVNGKERVLNQEEVSKIVVSRLEEMLNLCKKEINILTKKEISYIIFTGGLAELKEFRTFAMNIFDENIKVGSIFEMGVRNNKYSSCLGLIKYYAYDAKLKDKDYSIFTIEEQQQLGGSDLDSQNENKVGKLFGYIFNG